MQIKESEEENYLEVQVNDTGVGIHPEKQKHLFNLFNTIQNSNQMNTSGIGLGLTTCVQIVKQFDGYISIHSTLNIGSTFKFTFKLQKEDHQEDQIFQNQMNLLNSREMKFTWRPPLRNIDRQVKYVYNLQNGGNQSIRERDPDQIDSL